jgi:hypothetical protein
MLGSIQLAHVCWCQLAGVDLVNPAAGPERIRSTAANINYCNTMQSQHQEYPQACCCYTPLKNPATQSPENRAHLEDAHAHADAVLAGGVPVVLLHTAITNEGCVQGGEIVTCATMKQQQQRRISISSCSRYSICDARPLCEHCAVSCTGKCG